MRLNEVQDILDEITIDSFAGGGGTSEGHVEALGRDPDIAINHDRYALAMHRINHPGTRHLVEDVVTVDARSMCDGRPIGLLWMSPDCKDHSKAKGGKPRDKNIRGLAWAVFGWVKALPAWQRPRVIILENVEEFEEWSPLRADGKRCPRSKGVIFEQFISSFRAVGYKKIEWRRRRAWWSGAGTIRRRLYVIMRRDDEPIVWPAPTHGDPNDPVQAERIARGELKPWVTAADNINFALPCPSIFDTAAEIKAKYGVRAIRPLQPSTMARLAKGTWRYVVTSAKPFIVPVTHKGDLRCNSVDEPHRTFTGARRGEHAVAVPILVGCGGRAAQTEPRSAASPIITQTGKADLCVVGAYLAKHYGDTGQRPGSPLDEPVSTITGADHNALVSAHMMTMRGTDRRGAPADVPLNTQSAQGTHSAAVYTHLTKYYGAGEPSQDANEPMHTDTAKPRFGVVDAIGEAPPLTDAQIARARQVADFLRAHGYWDDREFVTVGDRIITDMGMRMLTPRERFNAQGFRRDYIIDRGILEDGSVIKFTAEQQGYMCGNSVCPTEAAALIRANYRPRKVERPQRRPSAGFPLLEAAE
ncbi:DNA cytosine methyltransferase [Bradyrhizobium sp. SZCCHNR3015]|uniref:DNA cytosine methyltransferase n=1 Tax=Bradyrhizobium sp. SZCCHNR3015 TaxID=3057395 RepID=UPI002916F61F|nr:DNA cytosine methyltransferase [Bradyrhizobium sp. SZCCHNR3015]